MTYFSKELLIKSLFVMILRMDFNLKSIFLRNMCLTKIVKYC